MPQYFLNDKDKDRILAALDKLDAQGVQPSQYTPPENLMAPEVYVGILPCGETIPARSGDVPGVKKVCLYKMAGTAASGAGEGEPQQTYRLEPVLDLAGNQIRIDCYNIYDDPVTDGERYIQLQRSKYGRWMNERPSGAAASSPSDQLIPSPNPCTGSCAWTWHELEYQWVPDPTNVSACTQGTTPEPPDPCSQASASGDCSCCPGVEGYTNPSTTAAPTTTTLDPDQYVCACQYPSHCGNIDGETTITNCAVGTETSPLDCTTTTSSDTTTTSDCNCDTSTTLAACGDGCEWESGPLLMGGGSMGWFQISDDCAPRCPCSIPTAHIGQGECIETQTPCVEPGPPPPPPAPETCTGNCHFMWSDIQQHVTGGPGWTLIDEDCTRFSFCHGVFQNSQWNCCSCSEPSHTGSDCEMAVTNCALPPANSTTPDPCQPCYSTTTTPGPTTSSTTTSCDPCTACDYPQSRCCYNYSAECDQWVLIRDLCGGVAGSACNECLGFLDDPPPEVGGSGVSKCVPCQGGGTSTTTADPCGDSPCDLGTNCSQCLWKYSCDCDPPAWVEISIACNEADDGCACLYPDYECERSLDNWRACGSDFSVTVETTPPPACGQMYANYCLTGNTSTTTPTSTTTTTVEPTTTDTTVTTCDPTTTAPPESSTTTTVCPTTTTTTATSTTTTSCNPAADCEAPSGHYGNRCGDGGSFDPDDWGTCCCEGPCCIYATNVQAGCPHDEGALMNCMENSTVWHCIATGGECCGIDESCDTYFLGKGFTCEDCPDDHTGTTATSTTTTEDPEGSACCWDYGEECTEDLSYGECQSKEGSMKWEADTTCASLTCPTSLAPGDSACCYNYGTCVVNDQEACEALSESTWHEGKRCDQVECATTIEPGDGACCYDWGSCNVETESNCDARDSQSWTADVGCGAVTCPTTTTAAPTGSCCYNFGTCTAGMTESACEAQADFDAWYEGEGCPPSTACATTAGPPGCDCATETCTYEWTCDPAHGPSVCCSTGFWVLTGGTCESVCGDDCSCSEPASCGTSNGEVGAGTCGDI